MNYDFNNEIKAMERDIRELNTAYKAGAMVQMYSYTHNYNATPAISANNDYNIVFGDGTQPIIVEVLGFPVNMLAPSENKVKFHTEPQAPTTFTFLSTRPILRIERAGSAS